MSTMVDGRTRMNFLEKVGIVTLSHYLEGWTSTTELIPASPKQGTTSFIDCLDQSSSERPVDC